ncbi:hypothetical protein FOA52_012952 [Chlamydomonas sp. UWO 241]|nr:hypothetical protein FOA52_012952 [Chlamydomonas sp. UWO 241]
MRAPPHSPSTSPTNRGGPASSPASKRPQPPPEAIGLGRPVQWTNAENLKIVGRLVEGSSTKNLVILCHGYASSKDSPLNCRLARELSSKGFSSLRFDFSGNGESDGVFSFSSYYKEIADAGHSSDALAVVLAVVQAQTQQIASLVDLVHLLVSRVPGAPMQMPHAVPHAAHSAPRAAPAAKAAQPARPAAAAAPVASAAGAPAAERPAAAGAARAASARGPSRQGGLPARVGETSLCRSHVLSIPVAAATRLIAGHGSECQMARDGIVRGALRDASYLGSTRHVRRLFIDCYGSEETVVAAAVRVAAAAVDGVSLPVCLAMNLVRFVHDVSGRDRPAGGGVVSASFLNAKPAVGGIGVEPRRGGVLRVLFTVASDAVADTVVRSRRNLRDVDPSAAVFDVLSDREEAQHRALWPAFLAAKAAGKRAQFHRARLVVDGERVRDLQSAVAYARGTLGRMVVAIVGHSKGGDVVLMYGSAFDDVPLVVNIAGRFNMTRGFRERFGEATIAKVEHLGQVKQKVMSDLGQPIEFMLTKHDLAERAGIDMVAVCSKITLAEVLTVHGSGDTVIPIEDAQAFASAIRQHQLLVVEGADHNFRTPAHAEEAVRKIVAFIEGGV